MRKTDRKPNPTLQFCYYFDYGLHGVNSTHGCSIDEEKISLE